MESVKSVTAYIYRVESLSGNFEILSGNNFPLFMSNYIFILIHSSLFGRGLSHFYS